MSGDTRASVATRARDEIEEHLPRIERGTTPDREALLLTVGLLAGLMVGVPAFAAVTDAIGLPIPLPLLVGVGLVGAAYTVAVVLLRRWVVGSVVATVVLATFHANLPVLPVAHQFPKDVVGDLLLVHVPLAALVAIGVSRGWHRRLRTLPVALLAAFVLVTAVPAVLGRSPSPLAAASFSAFVLLALVAFIATITVVENGLLRFRTVLSVLLLAVGGHVLVGLAQLVNQDPFGLTRLGEGGPEKRVAVEFPVVGDATIGPFVSGFTGMSFVLAYLVVLVFCLGLVVASRRAGGRRLAAVAGLLAMVTVVRASASDAARGALPVAIVAFVGAMAWVYRDRLVAAVRRAKARPSEGIRNVGSIAAGALGLAILGLPSAVSGSSVGAGGGADAGGSSSGGSGGSGSSSGGSGGSGSSSGGSSGSGSSSGGSGDGAVPETVGGVDLQQLSVPLFDVSNLGVRLQQYLVAVDVFLQYPVFGLGGMNYVLMAGEYGLDAPAGRNFPNAIHSVYFTLLAETGAVGTALYLGAVVLLVGWRLVGREGADDALVLAALAGLVGTLAFSAFDMFHLYAAAGLFPFWVVAGAVVGEARRLDAGGVL